MKLLLFFFAFSLQAAVYKVGPGQPYASPDLVPINSAPAGSRILIYGKPTPYLSKLTIHNSNLAIMGIPGPNGEEVVLDLNGAVENKDVKYTSTQFGNVGLITIVTGVGFANPPSNISISGLTIQNASMDNHTVAFTTWDGKPGWAYTSTGGISIYGAKNVRLTDLVLLKNGNGIFAKNMPWPPSDTEDLYIGNCDFKENGRKGSDRQHNVYLESKRPTVEFNSLGAPVSGSAGNNFKDRSERLVFRYNYLVAGARHMDLVNPEDMLPGNEYGTDYVYGNVFINPEWHWQATSVHYGHEYGPYLRKLLYFYNNTYLSVNDQTVGMWKRGIFHFDSGESVVKAYNNLAAQLSPDPNHYSGDFYWSWGVGQVQFAKNFSTPFIDAGGLTGKENLRISWNPGFINFQQYNLALMPGGGAKNCAGRIPPFLPPVEFQPITGRREVRWVERPSVRSCGAIE